jgi:hypothetical protein
MSLVDAVIEAGPIPPNSSPRETKKNFSEALSAALALHVAGGLRDTGFSGTRPFPGGPGEKAFQGGLGPKKVDVSFSDEQHGLLLAVSIKTINFPEFGKNLKNRFSDVLAEAITLHMRFPYSVVGTLFAFPAAANQDITPRRSSPTFAQAMRLLGTVAGREEYTDPGEKFEFVTLMLYQPLLDAGTQCWVKLFDAATQTEISEQVLHEQIRAIYNRRNPHAPVAEEQVGEDE